MKTETPVLFYVPDSRVYCLLCTARYGAISYWVDVFDTVDPVEPRPDPEIDGTESLPLRPGGAWLITSGSGPGETPRVDRLDRDAITRGLATMAKIAPQHFADLLTENDDAVTADVFVQCCLFGEIVYG